MPPTSAEIVRVQALRRRGRPRDMPHRITLQVTNLCNHRCTACDIWKIYRTEDSEVGPHDELTMPQWVALATSAFDQGVDTIDITGGEPFLKPGLEDLVLLALQRSGFVCVVTNALQGPRTAERVERVLQAAPESSRLVLCVSIDGFEATHDQLRGVRGAHARAIGLLEALRDMRRRYVQLIPSVSYTISPDNCDQMNDLLAFLLREGLIGSADDFSFRPVAGGHYYRKSLLRPSIAGLGTAIEQALNTHRFERGRPFFAGLQTHVRDPGRMLLPCFAMFTSCWIDPYGNVSPCVSMTEVTVGNVRDHDLDLRALWHSTEASRLRAEIAQARCPVCWTDCQAHENIVFNGHDRSWTPECTAPNAAGGV